MQIGFMRRLVAALFMTVAVWNVPCSGQSTDAAVGGQITDEQGRAVPGVAVLLTNLNTGVIYGAKTNGDGFYSAPNLPPGIYRANVTKDGFKSVVKSEIELHVQDTASINFQLHVGSVAETVTVEAAGLVVNTTDATVSTVVDRDLVENLPLNGRSFQQLITLAPGANLSTASGYGGFTVNGQRPDSNYFTIDGVAANIGPDRITGGGTTFGSSALGGTNSLISVDALQEFRVLTSSYAPEYGRTPGAQVIFLTRSGTNDFHGNAFEYFRNDVLDANDWFANENGAARSPLRFNDFGGTLGGPVLKNKTFFFFSYEGQRMRQPQFTISDVPDSASRQAAPAGIQAILNAFPVANGPLLSNGQAQFSAGYSNPLSANATSFRLDQVFNSKLTAFARYNYSPSVAYTRGNDGNLASLERLPYKAQTATGGITYIISPQIIDEFRLNYSHASQGEVYALDTFGGAVPVPSNLLFIPPLGPTNAFSFVSFGFAAFYDGTNTGNKMSQINLVDGLSYSRGSHQFKFGVDYRRLLPYNSGAAADDYFFNNIASAIQNSVQEFVAFVSSRTRGEINNYSLYAQDSWRVSPRLSVTGGVRWEVNTPPRNRNANNGNYVPLLGNYVTGDVEAGLAGSSLWNTQYLNFAPRVGVAYQVRTSPGSETVIRGGAGLFYDLGTGYAAIGPWLNGFPNSNYALASGTPFPVDPALAVIPPVDLANPASGQAFYVFPHNLALPRTWQWNIAIQQSLGSQQTVTISYVAALGRKLLSFETYPSVSSEDYTVYETENSSRSDYESLQLQYQRRLSHGLTATAGYTLGHSIDDNSNGENPVPPGAYLSPNVNKGPSDFDIRHTLHAALSYNIPGDRKTRWLGALTRGWGLDSIITATSALPVDVLSYENGFLSGYFALRPDLVPGQPLYLYGSHCLQAPPLGLGQSCPGGRGFNPNAFVVNPNQDQEGDLGRNSLRGFPLVQVDLSVRRSFRLAEHINLLFRADMFNLFNHPNFAPPDGYLGDGTFGLSTSMLNSQIAGSQGNPQANYGVNPAFQIGGPRTVQLSLKLQF